MTSNWPAFSNLMIPSLPKTGGLFNIVPIGEMFADDAGAMDVCDETMTVEAAMMASDDVIDSVSPNLLTYKSEDECSIDELCPELSALPDLPELEDFIDLTEFFDFSRPCSPDDDLTPTPAAMCNLAFGFSVDAVQAASNILAISDVETCSSIPSTSTTVSLDTLPELLPEIAEILQPSDHSYYHPAKRKSLAEDDADDDDDDIAEPSKRTRYLERRRKNNVASKRSREIRKQKLVSMEEEAVELEQANLKLRQRVTELEHITQLMKTALMEALSSCD